MVHSKIALIKTPSMDRLKGIRKIYYPPLELAGLTKVLRDNNYDVELYDLDTVNEYRKKI